MACTILRCKSVLLLLLIGLATAGMPARATEPAGIAVLLRLRAGGRVLSFLSMTTVFGTPIDITLSELAIEAFLPADAATAELLRG